MNLSPLLREGITRSKAGRLSIGFIQRHKHFALVALYILSDGFALKSIDKGWNTRYSKYKLFAKEHFSE